MLPKTELKKIAQLGLKKFRDQTGLFIVEGQKSVVDFLDQGWHCEGLYSTQKFDGLQTNMISEKEMQRITQFKAASPILGIFQKRLSSAIPTQESALLLDGISDPGNLGTIIRQASWFGVSHVICSTQSVDAYNPKVVQASMGGLARVTVHYTNLESFLFRATLPIYGLALTGLPIQKVSWDRPAYLAFGSESHGISEAVLGKLTQCVTIPAVGHSAVESLNVASAAAIVLASFTNP